MLYWLWGDIANVKGRFKNFNHRNLAIAEDTGMVTFDFVGGGSCQFNYSTSTYSANVESSMTVLAERGSIKIDGQYMDTVTYCLIDGYDVQHVPSPSLPSIHTNHSKFIGSFIEGVFNNNRAMHGAIDSVKVVEIIERIYQVRDTSLPE